MLLNLKQHLVGNLPLFWLVGKFVYNFFNDIAFTFIKKNWGLVQPKPTSVYRIMSTELNVWHLCQSFDAYLGIFGTF